jgi:hypothetical protein
LLNVLVQIANKIGLQEKETVKIAVDTNLENNKQIRENKTAPQQ